MSDTMTESKRVESSGKERYSSLNGLRTLACVGIVAMHVNANVDIHPTPNVLVDVISFAGNFVLMFMMVSAFSMCCGYFERIQNGNISMDAFYKKRYTRILPFFLLLVIIDVIKTFASEGFSWTDILIAELWESFADITLLFGFIPNHNIEVVGVSWFLGVIFLFYLLFPFFTFLLANKKRAWLAFAIVLGLYFSVRYYFNPIKESSFDNTSLIHDLPYFMLGGLLFLYRKAIVKIMSDKAPRMVFRFVVLVYTAWFFLFSEQRFELANLILYALWLIYAICESVGVRRTTFLNNKMMTFFSGISMEVYLCHMMIFRVVEKIHLEKMLSNVDLFYYSSFILTLVGAIAFSWVWKKWMEPKVLSVIER